MPLLKMRVFDETVVPGSWTLEVLLRIEYMFDGSFTARGSKETGDTLLLVWLLGVKLDDYFVVFGGLL